MKTGLQSPHGRKRRGSARDKRKVFNRLIENQLISRVSFEEYRDKVRDVYDGPKGAMLSTCSMLSLHTPTRIPRAITWI